MTIDTTMTVGELVELLDERSAPDATWNAVTVELREVLCAAAGLFDDYDDYVCWGAICIVLDGIKNKSNYDERTALSILEGMAMISNSEPLMDAAEDLTPATRARLEAINAIADVEARNDAETVALSPITAGR